ncbi:MAG: DNA polymerase thumb domain-containing protein [Eubacteriales bacterium]
MNGLTVVTKDDLPRKLWPLPVKELFGVGGRTEKKLRYFGINTIGDLAKYPVEPLERKFGAVGRVLHLSANGIDYSPVDPHSLDSVKSIGNQLTLTHDYAGDEIKVAIVWLQQYSAVRLNYGGRYIL